MGKQSYQPDTQPDFGIGFRTDSDAPIRYESRRLTGNHRHDVVRLSSYLHDAKFRLDEIELHRRSLVIPLHRARWELDRGHGDLIYIHSKLTISRVVSFRLELAAAYMLQKEFLHAPEVIIFNLQNISEQWEDSDDTELIFDFSRAKLRVRVKYDFRVRLQDSPASPDPPQRRKATRQANTMKG